MKVPQKVIQMSRGFKKLVQNMISATDNLRINFVAFKQLVLGWRPKIEVLGLPDYGCPVKIFDPTDPNYALFSGYVLPRDQNVESVHIDTVNNIDGFRILTPGWILAQSTQDGDILYVGHKEYHQKTEPKIIAGKKYYEKHDNTYTVAWMYTPTNDTIVDPAKTYYYGEAGAYVDATEELAPFIGLPFPTGKIYYEHVEIGSALTDGRAFPAGTTYWCENTSNKFFDIARADANAGVTYAMHYVNALIPVGVNDMVYWKKVPNVKMMLHYFPFRPVS